MNTLKALALAELKKLLGQIEEEVAAREGGASDSDQKWWACAGNGKAAIHDAGELVDGVRQLGYSPILRYTDKGICVGVGIGKTVACGTTWGKGADPFMALDRFLAGKGFIRTDA